MDILLNEKEMAVAIQKITKEIREDVPQLEDLVLVGIRTRGVPLAERVAASLKVAHGVTVPVGKLDINLYRDDLGLKKGHPNIQQTDIPCAIDDKKVFILDDVLYTGRTIRCALNALFDFGRPQFIGLAVLVDRGGRELPLQADVCGVSREVKEGQEIKVKFKEIDGEDCVEIS